MEIFRPGLRPPRLPLLLVSAILAWPLCAAEEARVPLKPVRDWALEILGNQAMLRLGAVREEKKRQVEAYFERQAQQLLFLAHTPAIPPLLQEFTQAFAAFGQAARLEPKDFAEYRQAMQDYYQADFPRAYAIDRGIAAPRLPELPAELSTGVLALQYRYLAANPHPPAYKEELRAAEDGTEYGRLHAVWHPYLDEFTRRGGVEDLYLLDPAGNVVYSVRKRPDFAGNVSDGAYAQSGLGQVFAKAVVLRDPEQVALVDFSAYLPAFDRQAAFMGVPVTGGDGQLLGVLAVQLPGEAVSDLVTNRRTWPADAFGASGDAYLVGTDTLPRSHLRAVAEDPAGFLRDLENAGVDGELRARIAAARTAVGLLPLRAPLLRTALAGVTGFDAYEDYNGGLALAAFAPVDAYGLRWALLVSQQEKESLAAVDALEQRLAQAPAAAETPAAAPPAALKIGLATGADNLLWRYAREQELPRHYAEEIKLAAPLEWVEDSYPRLLSAFLQGQVDALLMPRADALVYVPASGLEADVVLATQSSRGADAVWLGQPPPGGPGCWGMAVDKAVAGNYLLNRYLLGQGIPPERIKRLPAADPPELALARPGLAGLVGGAFGVVPHSARPVFDSSAVPGEMQQVLVVRRAALQAQPRFAQVLLATWFAVQSRLGGGEREAVLQSLTRLHGGSEADMERLLAAYAFTATPAQAFDGLLDTRLNRKIQHYALWFLGPWDMSGQPAAGFERISYPGGPPAALHFNNRPLRDLLDQS